MCVGGWVGLRVYHSHAFVLTLLRRSNLSLRSDQIQSACVCVCVCVCLSAFRNKTIVGSMKTTLRERWQEVVEEITRSNLPNIYLLTVDEDISILKAKQMAEHNIVPVVLKKIKEQPSLNKMRNIIDFETFFTKEIPSVMDYWENNND